MKGKMIDKSGLEVVLYSGLPKSFEAHRNVKKPPPKGRCGPNYAWEPP